MKALLLVVLASVLAAGCSTTPADKADAAAPAAVKNVEQFFATDVAKGRAYEPLHTVRLHVPAQAMPGEQWFQHEYRLTDSTGRAVVQIDTAVVQADGQVLYY